MKLLSGSSNLPLAQSIAQGLQIPLVNAEITHFANNERRVWIKDDVRGENVVLVQSFSDPADEHIMEFLLMVDALERMGARHVNAVIPWMGYSLQDKVFRYGEPIAAKVVANLVSNTYVKRVFLLDLHNTSTPGFFSIPSVHVSALQLFAQYIKDKFDQNNLIVASPDFGGLKRARTFADVLNTELINIDKHRDLTTGEVSAQSVQGGSAKGKTVVLFDDCVLSGATVLEAAALLKKEGAQEVHFVATHGLFTGDA
ncbi:ribose-phosphate pyrophosphokinase, partial [Candidatus Woesebacteria bacterium]|nr:ribose-phosphate pyrophosphokinase [Candidatus Woesebacteria bacterium]